MKPAKVACRFKRGDIVMVSRLSTLSTGLIRFAAEVLTISDGHAMLRRKGYSPFLESVRDLEKWNPKT
jgi:hypothetical protein